MPIRINNIRASLEDDFQSVKKAAARLVNIKDDDIRSFRILRESVDARKKNDIHLIYHVEFQCDNEKRAVEKANNNNVILEELIMDEPMVYGNKKLNNRPVIVGSGPAGLFAGLVMAKNGYAPIILERGGSVEERELKIKEFWKSGSLDTNTNIQFGEGGAGTFSDGKLTTRIKDKRCDYVLEEFIRAGAPEEIAYLGKPHIGTDILKDVVRNIRSSIIASGGEVRFNSRVTDLIIKNGSICGVKINDEYEISADAVVIAVGHSARDTYEMLLRRGMIFHHKPFAIGVRIEHLQGMIDEIQYGRFASHPKLRAADYRLTYTSKKYNRPCYSFCMCPGGLVVAAASEEKRLVTNGMSEYKRDRENANSAIVVGVGPADFPSSDPLAGVEFQRHYESLAFKTGGGSYMAPVQLVGDFLKDKASAKTGSVKPSYTRGYNLADLRNCLPPYVVNVLKEGILDFDRKIKGFAGYDSILTGIETRTSSPIRMERDESLEAAGIKGLFPAGEGAGYAGGIMSAAVDGVKAAERIMKEFSPSNKK